MIVNKQAFVDILDPNSTNTPVNTPTNISQLLGAQNENSIKTVTKKVLQPSREADVKAKQNIDIQSCTNNKTASDSQNENIATITSVSTQVLQPPKEADDDQNKVKVVLSPETHSIIVNFFEIFKEINIRCLAILTLDNVFDLGLAMLINRCADDPAFTEAMLLSLSEFFSDSSGNLKKPKFTIDFLKIIKPLSPATKTAVYNKLGALEKLGTLLPTFHDEIFGTLDGFDPMDAVRFISSTYFSYFILFTKAIKKTLSIKEFSHNKLLQNLDALENVLINFVKRAFRDISKEFNQAAHSQYTSDRRINLIFYQINYFYYAYNRKSAIFKKQIHKKCIQIELLVHVERHGTKCPIDPSVPAYKKIEAIICKLCSIEFNMIFKECAFYFLDWLQNFKDKEAFETLINNSPNIFYLSFGNIVRMAQAQQGTIPSMEQLRNWYLATNHSVSSNQEMIFAFCLHLYREGKKHFEEFQKEFSDLIPPSLHKYLKTDFDRNIMANLEIFKLLPGMQKQHSRGLSYRILCKFLNEILYSFDPTDADHLTLALKEKSLPILASTCINNCMEAMNQINHTLGQLTIYDNVIKKVCQKISSTLAHTGTGPYVLSEPEMVDDSWLAEIDNFNLAATTESISPTASAQPNPEDSESDEKEDHSLSAAPSISLSKPLFQLPAEMPEKIVDLLGLFRNGLAKYYDLPHSLFFPHKLHHKILGDAARHQQIFALDTLQRILEMQAVCRNDGGQHLLSAYLFLWMHQAMEQGLTAQYVAQHPTVHEADLPHALSQLLEHLNLDKKYDCVSTNNVGTFVLRYPYHCQGALRPPLEMSLSLRHMIVPPANASFNTKVEIEQRTNLWLKELIQIFHLSLRVKETNTKEQDFLTYAIALQEKISSGKAVATPVTKLSLPEKCQAVLTKKAQALKETMEELQKQIALLENNPLCVNKIKSLRNVAVHLNHLHNSLKLTQGLPHLRFLYIHALMGMISTQYAIENLGTYISLKHFDYCRTHDLRKFCDDYQMDASLSTKQKNTLQSLNAFKGSEYLCKTFHQFSDPLVVARMTRLSEWYMRACIAIRDGDDFTPPQLAQKNVSQLQQELVEDLDAFVNLLTTLLKNHLSTL